MVVTAPASPVAASRSVRQTSLVAGSELVERLVQPRPALQDQACSATTSATMKRFLTRLLYTSVSACRARRLGTFGCRRKTVECRHEAQAAPI